MDEHPNAKAIRQMIEDPVNYEDAFVTDDVEWTVLGTVIGP